MSVGAAAPCLLILSKHGFMNMPLRYYIICILLQVCDLISFDHIILSPTIGNILLGVVAHAPHPRAHTPEPSWAAHEADPCSLCHLPKPLCAGEEDKHPASAVQDDSPPLPSLPPGARGCRVSPALHSFCLSSAVTQTSCTWFICHPGGRGGVCSCWLLLEMCMFSLNSMRVSTRLG